MSACDYCPSDALWLAAAESATAGMTRLACQGHVDQARCHCSAVGVPTITAVPARSASKPKRTAAMPSLDDFLNLNRRAESAEQERDRLHAAADQLTAERDQLVLDLDDMRQVARGNMRHVATLTGLLDAVENLATTWTSRPGTPEHDCGSDILHAINGGTVAAILGGDR